MSQSANKLLASLSPGIFASLQPHLKEVELTLGDVLAEAGAEVKSVYFPHSGVISLVVELSIGAMIETAMIGRDGVLNASSALDGKISLNKGIVQLSGRTSVISVDHFRRIAKEHDAFRLFSFDMSKFYLLSRNNPQLAMPATQLNPECVAGCFACVILLTVTI